MDHFQKTNKMNKLIIIIVFSFSTIVKGQDFLALSEMREMMLELEKKKDKLDVLYEAIENLKFSVDPVGCNEFTPIENLVPLVGFICSNYDSRISPLLFYYALNSDCEYFSKRAIFCIEKLEKITIKNYLEDKMRIAILPKNYIKIIERSSVNVRLNLKVEDSPNKVLPKNFYLPFPGEDLLKKLTERPFPGN